MSQVTLVPILLWVAALASAVVAIWQGPRPIDRSFVIDRLLLYLFVFPLGLLGLWAFLGHVFFAEQSAASIGWAPSPFQYEVGVANLGLALAALYAAFRGFEARLAVAIASVLPHRSRHFAYQGHRRGRQSCAGQCRADHGHRLSHADR